ncbi:hypothetical protein PoB_006090800 [Plakobranchus ocellatus]|uniref:Uncharacterized protein n=1 Tax=Plakobranchus ocellatus TaxID=259542 RepID=A0AAV4CR84_9GAST|nr:hypothetical protein PoB_006090800 [Plakobranchus ocellatus]
MRVADRVDSGAKYKVGSGSGRISTMNSERLGQPVDADVRRHDHHYLVVRSLVRTIRKRQATFLGHMMKRGKLEHLVTTGKFEGKRSRGRQREKIMDGLATWLGPGKVLDTLTAVKDRDLWRDMIANAYKQGT